MELNIFQKLQQLYRKWKALKPLPFVIITIWLTLLTALPIESVMSLCGVSLEEIGGPLFLKKRSLGQIAFVAILLAPLFETFLFQYLPIKIVQKLVKLKTNKIAVVVSTFFFAINHLPYSFWYFLLVLPIGVILAITYIVFRQRNHSPYWMTFLVHAARNAVAVLITMLQKL